MELPRFPNNFRSSYISLSANFRSLERVFKINKLKLYALGLLVLAVVSCSPAPGINRNENIYLPPEGIFVDGSKYCQSILGPPESRDCPSIRLDGINISQISGHEQRAFLYREGDDISNVELYLNAHIGIADQKKTGELEPVLSLLLLGQNPTNIKTISDYYRVPDYGEVITLKNDESYNPHLSLSPNGRIFLTVQRCEDDVNSLCARGIVGEFEDS